MTLTVCDHVPIVVSFPRHSSFVVVVVVVDVVGHCCWWVSGRGRQVGRIIPTGVVAVVVVEEDNWGPVRNPCPLVCCCCWVLPYDEMAWHY